MKCLGQPWVAATTPVLVEVVRSGCSQYSMRHGIATAQVREAGCAVGKHEALRAAALSGQGNKGIVGVSVARQEH
jgi:hypothetical protein